jgi:hypothetical protein
VARIRDQFLNSVLYLYSSEEDARRGTKRGGTGFLYGIPNLSRSDSYWVFVVTCRHLIEKEFLYLRINTIDSGYKIFETKETDWFPDPTEDLAIYLLPFDSDLNVSYIIDGKDTVDQDLISRINIGPGDDVYIVGRFIQHDGIQQNTPVVRFGNLAMLPSEPVYNDEIKLETLCYLVDVRLREGFSGSPVFVQCFNRFSREGSESSGPWNVEKLLGICWGGFKTKQDVRIGNGDTTIPGYAVPIHEAMACVIPSERISKLTHQYVLKEEGQ